MWDPLGDQSGPDPNKYERVWENIRRRESLLVVWRPTAQDEAWLNELGITGRTGTGDE